MAELASDALGPNQLSRFDVQLFVEQLGGTGLTLISPFLYELSGDSGLLLFHDTTRADMFWIHLNEFIKTTFPSPLDGKRCTLFQLAHTYFSMYSPNPAVDQYLETSTTLSEFLFRKRHYLYYISPHDLQFETSLAELVWIQANYSKHNLFHLSNVKERLKKYFLNAGISTVEDENYNEHLGYFKEAVLDDRLNFNQTHIVEHLGKYFLSLWDLMNSSDRRRIDEAVWQYISEHGRLAPLNMIQEPPDMSPIERFHWENKWHSRIERGRLEHLVPHTPHVLIEEDTSISNPLRRNR
ncbi:MAG: hypothetical protein JNM31_06690 [Flavobacteriales bacterium]|nr:hypothetical protein [Flavobacteriales bacterium]